MSVKAVATIQFVSIGNTMPDGQFLVSYTVAVNNNGTGLTWSGDAAVSALQTIPQFQTAAKNKIVQDCAGKGITLLPADVIIFATPF